LQIVSSPQPGKNGMLGEKNSASKKSQDEAIRGKKGKERNVGKQMLRTYFCH
jgi:hypothetical protein